MDKMNISIEGTTVLDWFFTATALILTAGRYYIRYKDHKRLYWDDALHLLGVICGLGSVVAMQILLGLAQGLENGPEAVPSPEILIEFLQIQSAQSILFFSCVYSIKAAFLAFYRQLFGSNEWFNRAWWLVSAFTMASYIASITGSITLCGPAQDLGSLTLCNTPQAIDNEFRLMYYSTILNILTDICIMILPIWVLRSIQIPRKQKFGLGILFSLGLIIIAFELFRFFEFLPLTDSGGSFTMPIIWSCLETNIAIVVSCLPIYRTLLDNEKKRIARRSRLETAAAQPGYTTFLNVGKQNSLSTVHTHDSNGSPPNGTPPNTKPTPPTNGQPANWDIALPTVLRGPEIEQV